MERLKDKHIKLELSSLNHSVVESPQVECSVDQPVIGTEIVT